jgi:predicted nucleic acid-binding protein
MTFLDIIGGLAIFLDANTFVYYFSLHPTFGPACRQLLERLERQELQGYTSAHVLNEMAHRLMAIEAGALFG